MDICILQHSGGVDNSYKIYLLETKLHIKKMYILLDTPITLIS
jgi:hypothetical protein